MVYFAIAALLELIMHAWVSRRVWPQLPFFPILAFRPLVGSWRYSMAMNAISIQGIILTQADRWTIGSLRPAHELGAYGIAAAIANGMSQVQGFITSAIFPVFSEKHRKGEYDNVEDIYRWASQALVFLLAGIGIGLGTFAGVLLSFILNDRDVALVAPPLALLALGTVLNCIVAMPFTLSISIGNPVRTMLTNCVAIGWYIPAMVMMVYGFGYSGAAMTWVFLNIFYMLVLLPRLHEQYSRRPLAQWLMTCVFPFVGVAAALFGGARIIHYWSGEGIGHGLLMFSVAASVYLVVGWKLLDPTIRQTAIRTIKSR